MAVYNLENYTSADGLGFPLNFRRGNPNPLDNSSTWSSLVAAQNYAANDPVAYVGQVLTVVTADEEGNTTVKAYTIQDEAGTLKEIGVIPTGDDKTISVTSDGQISLLAKDTEVSGAINAGAQLVLQADGTIKWVQPDTSTAEGQAVAIADLQNRTTALETNDTRLEGLITDNANDISELQTSLTNYYNKTEIDETVTGLRNDISAIPKFAVAVVSKNAESGLPDVTNPNTTTVYLVPDNDTKTADVYDEYLYVKTGESTYVWELLGKQTLDLSAYAKTADVKSAIDTAVKAEADRAKAAESANATAAAEAKTQADKGVADAATAQAAAEAAQSSVDSLAEIVSGTGENSVSSKINALQASVSTNTNNIKTNTDAISAINNETTGILAQAKADAESKVATLKSEVDTKFTTVNNSISNLESANTDLAARVKTTEDSISLLTGDESTVGSVANSIKTAIGAIPSAQQSTLGLMKGSDKVSVSNGQITSVTTDTLTQGTELLILAGGSGLFD